AAGSAWATRAAERLARRRSQDALRLLARQASDRGTGPRNRASSQRADHGEFPNPCPGNADRGGQEVGRGDALRREIRRRGARPRHWLIPGILRWYARSAYRRYRSVQDVLAKRR